MEVLTIAKLDHQLNEEIRDKEIRLIGADGAQLGIMSSAQANAMAEEQGMDLVKISPNATPPVCKIMDYSKFCFDQKKREKEEQKMRNNMRVGDEITTIGGICGRVVTIRDDSLVIETGADRNKMTIKKWAVQSCDTVHDPKEDDDDDDDDDI